MHRQHEHAPQRTWSAKHKRPGSATQYALTCPAAANLHKCTFGVLQVAKRLRGSVCSKQQAYGDVLCPLIAEACIAVCPPNAANFEVDNVRVCKIVGAGVSNSSVVRGVVIRRGPEGTIKSATDAKVAVFAQGVDTSSTETKVLAWSLFVALGPWLQEGGALWLWSGASRSGRCRLAGSWGVHVDCSSAGLQVHLVSDLSCSLAAACQGFCS